MNKSIPAPSFFRHAILAMMAVTSVALAGFVAGVRFISGPTVQFSVGFAATPQSFVLHDMNRDDLADVVSVEQITGGVAVLLNRGDGGFTAPQSVILDVFPSGLAVADLNGDSYPDVAVTDDEGGVSLLFGDANGRIQLVDQIDPGLELTGIVAADLDEDGAIDLALLEVCDEIILQRNLGNGSFDCFEEEFLETGSIDPIGFSSGDVNGDGHADLLVLNRSGENVSLLLGNGDGTFQLPLQFPVGASPRAFAVGRVDGDTLDDVVVVDAGFFDDNVSVLLGDMNLGLRATPKSLAPFNATAVALADFDGDRCLDFVVSSLDEVAPAIGLGDCTGGFAIPLATTALGFGSAVQAGHLDQNDRVDFLMLDEDGELLSSALNQPRFSCVGDCNTSGAVAVDELVTGVNILLDRAQLASCSMLDGNHDGSVTVDELVRAVNNLLRGCA